MNFKLLLLSTEEEVLRWQSYSASRISDFPRLLAACPYAKGWSTRARLSCPWLLPFFYRVLHKGARRTSKDRALQT